MSSLQFNLLPDVKLEYVKARRTQRLVIVVAVLASGVALALMVFMILVVDVFQKQDLKHINSDITANTNQLKAVPSLDRVLTVQNQLSSLPDIDNKKPATQRLFDYIAKLTPNTAGITQLQIDYTQHLVTLNGMTTGLDVVNTFVDTLKFTSYNATSTSGNTSGSAFSNVVLSSFGHTDSSSGSGGTGATNFTVTFNYNPDIFDITKSVTLTVPNKITTRSEVDSPNALFEQSTTTTGKKQ